MENNIELLVEWAVWGHLDSKVDLELLLLKGHLILEIIIQTVLKRNDITECEDYSFNRKIIAFEKIDFLDIDKKLFLISCLKDINKLRNKIAHDFYFKIEDGEFESWSNIILKNLEGTKFTKYTFRTKIVHSFSILSINILQLENKKKK